MTVIGLTGGIASGKSTAAEMLREMGATIIDADRLGHRSYDPGTPGFEKVVNAFGHDIVGKDGLVDRRVLGGKVFGAPGQMERLNSIVWPEIRNLIKDEIKQIRSQDPGAIIVLEAAVLLEAQWQDLCDEIWVVTTPVKTAVARLRGRNGLSEDAAMARINSQMTNKERLEQAKVKIENVGTEDQLRAKIERPWRALEARMGRSRPATRKAAPSKSAKATKSAKSAAAKKNSSKTAPKAAAKTVVKAAAKPSRTAPAKAVAKASAGKSTKPVAMKVVKKAAAKSAAKPTAKLAAKPAGKGAAKPATKSAAAAKAPARKAVAPAAKPAAKTAPRKAAAASKAARPTTTTTARPAAKVTKAVAKPAAKTTKPAAKPAARKTATRAATRATSRAGAAGRSATRAGARSK
jgi:phosphopantetheine adenylyltransferase/dephospho-CoA kinase